MKTGLEDLIMRQEIYKADREDAELLSGSHRLTRKVTVRLDINAHAMLRILADRYDISATSMATDLLRVAVFDAAELAGVPADAMNETVKAELDKLNAEDCSTHGGFRETLAAHGMEQVAIDGEEF